MKAWAPIAMLCQNSDSDVTFLGTSLGLMLLYWQLLNMVKYSHENLCSGVYLPFCCLEFWYMENAGVTWKYFTQRSKSFFETCEYLSLNVSEENSPPFFRIKYDC